MKAFIQDKERVLDSANDLLKTGVYADSLVKVIENTPKDKVFTIGMFGSWGTGKSSIICTAKEKIEKVHKDVMFITYDAWKYVNDSFRRMFLLKVQQELKLSQTEEMKRFYQAETAEQEPKTVLSVKGLSAVIVVLSIVLALLWFIPMQLDWKLGITSLGTLLALVLALWNGCFYDLKLTINKPTLFAPEQFEACFKYMMNKCLKRKSWFQKIWNGIEYVTTGEDSIVDLEKLIIVVDNIDRCPSDMAYQLLTDIKTFLGNADYNLVFIVPVDDEALKKHLFRQWNNQTEVDINKEKEEFLRKFFNVTLRIKPHQQTELQHFTHEINRESHLGYSSDTLAIVAKEYADNPRQIIQLLNNLSGDLALYDDEFAAKYETAICVALILQESYPDFYKQVTKDLSLVKQSNVEGNNMNHEGTLDSFLRIIGNTLKQIPFNDLNRIFTNTSSIFSDIPVDLQKSLNSFDVVKVTEFAKDNEDLKSHLVDFALESMSNDVKYEATSQATQWIDFLSQLYKSDLFGASRFSVIDSSLSPYYNNAISAISDLDALCYLGNEMNEVGFTALRSAIVDYLNTEGLTIDSHLEKVLRAYFANFTSEKDCQDISSVVANYYHEKTIDQDIVFTGTQKRFIFDKSFILKQIESVTSIDDTLHINNIIWCIENNKDYSSETFISLFTKYITLFGSTRGKRKDDYLRLINSLQPVFLAFEKGSLPSELESIYKLVVSPRGIPSPPPRNTQQYDKRRSILDEVDVDEAKVVTVFCSEVMRISGGGTDVHDSINKLYHKCKETIIEESIKINALGISLKSWAPTLIQINDYDSTNDLLLLEILLSRQADGNFMLDDDTVKEKIHALIDSANDSGVEELLGRLVKDKQILDMVADYVASLDSVKVNSLPVSIAKYAVSSFNKENSAIFKDNVGYLILVLDYGNASQKKEVVRQMTIKIATEDDLDNVTLVLDHLETEDQKMLKTLVGELETVKESDTVGEETKKRVDVLATKLSTKIKKRD